MNNGIELGDNIVVKRNDFLQMAYSLSIQEQRIILCCVSQIDSREKATQNDEFVVSVQQIHDIFGDDTQKNMYRGLRDATDRLGNRWIVQRSDDSKRVMKLRWVWKIQYNDEKGDITLNFSRDVLDYLSDISKTFTKYKLSDVSQFRCMYSIRIYELLQQWSGVGEVEYSLEDLRERLDLGEKYGRWADFKRNVIDASVDEINKHSNLKVSYGVRKSRRKITGVQFNFTTKRKRNKKDIGPASEDKMMEFVRANEKLTRGKSEYEIRKLMSKGK
jgi:plasmid replication initiation protein